MKLAIKDIVVDPTVQIRRGNHEATVRRYEESFEKLPPVDVFKTDDGLLLADGFHRVAAAERLRLREVNATLHTGTREDALEFAVIANTKNADPFTPDERDEGIRRLRQLHPGWTNVRIAQVMSVSERTVRNVFQGDLVARSVVGTRRGAEIAKKPSILTEIASAPRPAWEGLATAAVERGWSRDATRQAVRNIRDDRIPEEHKRKLLAGKADPVVVTPEGQFAVPADVVGREIRERAANDAVLALERALEHLAKLRLFRPTIIVKTAGGARLDRLMDELPTDVAFLQEVLAEAKKERRRLEVVS